MVQSKMKKIMSQLQMKNGSLGVMVRILPVNKKQIRKYRYFATQNISR
jgi:hypothetical protein